MKIPQPGHDESCGQGAVPQAEEGADLRLVSGLVRDGPLRRIGEVALPGLALGDSLATTAGERRDQDLRKSRRDRRGTTLEKIMG